MSETPPPDPTELLRRFGAGDAEAGDALMGVVYEDLRHIAARHLARERPDHTLQPTALIHEAWMRLDRREGGEIPSRGHFLALASRVMRSLLVDHARRKKATKRGGLQERVALEDVAAPDGVAPGMPANLSSHSNPALEVLDVLALDEALARLESVDAGLARLVELRYFGGSTVAEASEAVSLPQRTVERRLRTATAWLRRELGDGA
ncbi:ECF-type sigma factor [Engelhardtia mirabilis]|uniref:RNA polymerase sigma factor n=1 Tax=Engelhardtia mirabilis TaxID=2528011 RepID=A0A518BDR2_9BACT|nr:RNA polymerase sigma factor [Planctomycetes bacterium Pla133]QDU99456.1 RNA polymerase sigma factor [Planctomycetes bacterium Pla86]